MTSGELLRILAACAYAIYQQTRRHEVVGSTRFKTAIVYAVIGLVVGGYNLPPNAASWAFLLVSILLSLAVGSPPRPHDPGLGRRAAGSTPRARA